MVVLGSIEEYEILYCFDKTDEFIENFGIFCNLVIKMNFINLFRLDLLDISKRNYLVI